MNLTAVPTADGLLRAVSRATPRSSGTSNLNFSAGKTRANNAVVRLATDQSGGVNVKNDSVSANHFILDVNGYFH